MSLATTLPTEIASETPFEGDSLYEIVNGERVEKPPMGNIQVVVTSLLFEKLAPYARSHGLGRVLTEPLFRINPPNGPFRRPDLAFLTFERWPRTSKVNVQNGFEIAPDLAIEIISPSNSADEVIQKIGEYFKAGVRRVWVVYPVSRMIHDYESPKKTTILDSADDLDGGELLPGFRLSLAELFEDGEVEV